MKHTLDWIMLLTCMLLITGCKTLSRSAEPAKHAKDHTSTQSPTLKQADLDGDGTLDTQEMRLADQLEQSQESTFPPYLSAFIAIVTAVVGATIIGMVISGFRAGSKRSDPPDTHDI